MDVQLTQVVEAALRSVAVPPEDEEAVSLLWLLLRRAEYSPGTVAFNEYSALIAQRHRQGAAAVRVDRDDVGDVIRRIADTMDAGPSRSATLVNLLVATHDERAADLLATLLDQFQPPVSGQDENIVSSAMSALHGLATRPRVKAALARWTDDAGELGDLARAELAATHFPSTWWNDRPLTWQTIEDVGSDAVAAIGLGWQDAPPIEALRAIVERERAQASRETHQPLLGGLLDIPRGTFDVSDEKLAAIAELAVRSAPSNVGAVGPLAAILAATATEATVPYLIDVARRNDSRSGFDAMVTRERLVSALSPFAGRTDVAALLAELSRRPSGDHRPGD